MDHRLLAFSFRVAKDCAKFHQNRIKIEIVGAWTDRQTDRQTYAGDL